MKTSMFCAGSLAAVFLGLSVPSASGVTLSFDFSHDAAMHNFFATNTTARAALDAAAADIGAAITTSLAEISHATLSGTNGATTANFTWSYNYTNPSTGGSESLANTSLPADTVRIYAGMRPLMGSTLGEGGFAGVGLGVSGSGSTAEWPGAVAAVEAASNAVYGRGGGPEMNTLAGEVSLGGLDQSFSVTFGPAVGHLWFDIDGNDDGLVDDAGTLENFWHFDHTAPVASGKNDFYSVALHEMLHALGIGSSDSWDALVSGSDWLGSDVISLVGSGTDLVSPGGDHIASDLMSPRLSDGELQEVAMSSSLLVGTRKELTEADLAFLRDIGWETVVIPEPSTMALGGLAALGLLLRRKRGNEIPAYGLPAGKSRHR